MSARLPATVRLSLNTLAGHGAEAGPQARAWGVALQEDSPLRPMGPSKAASSSSWANILDGHPIESSIVMAHVCETRARPALESAQPFVRELAGRMHAFAHNGRLPHLEEARPMGGDRLRPVGETDSELAFCLLLERLQSLWDSPVVPALSDRHGLIAQFAQEIRPLGLANFIYSDGDALFVHAHKRRQPGGAVSPPGLYMLYRAWEVREEPLMARVVTIHGGQADQEVALIASLPLSDEAWVPLAEGEVLAFRNGRVV